jgi:hypothetical protein
MMTFHSYLKSPEGILDCPFGSPHVLPLDQRKLAPEPIGPMGEAWRPLSSSMGLVYLQIMGKLWENYGKSMGKPWGKTYSTNATTVHFPHLLAGL